MDADADYIFGIVLLGLGIAFTVYYIATEIIKRNKKKQ
jgi:hypothetical protein